MMKAYGDRLGDGKVQLSFTLPVDCTENLELAKEAARQFAVLLNLQDPLVVSTESMGKGFSMFVVYGKTSVEIDLSKIEVVKVEVEAMGMAECDEFIKTHIKRKLVVIGACTGYDAHTVGIDAILNMKGYHGEYGLERYQMLDVYNLGAQVLNHELIDKAIELKADAILISQVVTEKNIHIDNLSEFIELYNKTKFPHGNPIVLMGGPRVNHALALELGYHAGFGPGTRPNIVSTFIVKKFYERLKQKNRHSR